MRIFGYNFTITKAPVPPTTVPSWNSSLGLPFWGSGGFPVIYEPFTGAWQRNMGLSAHSLMIFHAIYRCVTLISQDISKLRIRLMEENEDTDIATEVERNSPYLPVLAKPNRYQNRIQFFDDWLGSKLIHGNTYVLKERDARGIVTAMYILNPLRTRPRIGDDGSVYYELATDNLAPITEDQVIVPASEIIHDRYKPLYHPLQGVSPILACALSGMLGLRIQTNSSAFFQNASRPGGVLSAPEHIEDDTASRLKKHWEENYSGENAGRIAVLGDGLKYEAMRETSADSQLAEQLQISEHNVCTAFGVPPYMIGIGEAPSLRNVEALNQQYYSQCLQNLIETIELLLDEGLGLTEITTQSYCTEFDINELLRMDTEAKSRTWSELVKSGIAAPNEARYRFDLPPVKGGDAPYLQQQNFSLEALAKRDALDQPFAPAAPPTPAPAPGGDKPPAASDTKPPAATPPAKDYDDAEVRAAAVAKILRLSRYAARSLSV